MAQERNTEAAEADRLAARAIDGLPVTERRLELEGISTVVLEGGEGQQVVLLHGQGGFGAFMGGMAAQLVDRYRVIVPDLPGLGRSELHSGTLDAERVIDWLRELIAKTCDRPPILFGASLGGSIAARFAIAYPNEVSKIILMDSGSLGAFRPAPAVLFALIRFMKNPSVTAAERMQNVIFRDGGRLREQMGERLAALRDYQIERAKQPSVNHANRVLLRTLGTKRISDEALREIKVPVALIWGRQDRVMKFKIAERTSKKFGWPLYPIENAGHIPIVEQPAAFDAALREILEG
ncbi:MAG: alpha/beta fold hydrolase [Actinomycetota bacterium]